MGPTWDPHPHSAPGNHTARPGGAPGMGVTTSRGDRPGDLEARTLDYTRAAGQAGGGVPRPRRLGGLGG